MSPEMARGGFTSASDIFAFGVLAFDLLANCLPFHQPPVATRLSGKPFATPAPIATLCDDLPTVAAALIDQCLMEDPAHRPTARALADGLKDAYCAPRSASG
jgi:serine/threonine-protein kinase